MPLSEETKKVLREKDREDLIKIMEINDSGYAGVMPNGNIVDRREHPEAVAVQENKMMGIPAPKPVPNEPQGEYDQFWKQYAEEERKMEEANEKLASSIGKEDFDELTEDCRITGYLEVVDEPKGDDIDDPKGVFTEVWVDQWSTGDAGDTYAGNMYAKFGEGKWLKIPYDC